MDAEINKSIIIFKIIIFHKAISIQIGIHKNLNPSKSALQLSLEGYIYRSPNPRAVSSSLTTPATLKTAQTLRLSRFCVIKFESMWSIVSIKTVQNEHQFRIWSYLFLTLPSATSSKKHQRNLLFFVLRIKFSPKHSKK